MANEIVTARASGSLPCEIYSGDADSVVAWMLWFSLESGQRPRRPLLHRLRTIVDASVARFASVKCINKNGLFSRDDKRLDDRA